MLSSEIERNEHFLEGLRLMTEGKAFTFITGRAGTGKSTLLQCFLNETHLMIPVLAPTGVAALNVEGETIHSFFRFAPGITVKDAEHIGITKRGDKLYKKLDAIIIDEISMVRADLMDCIDAFLRACRKSKRPFGGIRIIAIGDLYQLPPVVNSAERDAFKLAYDSPYFFASRAFRTLLAEGDVSFLELETVYRQKDPTFVSLLNAVRNRTVTSTDLKPLYSRAKMPHPDAIILTPTNDAANATNEERLDALPGEAVIFTSEARGEFPKKDMPTDERLHLKKGARVMCIANDQRGRYVNGSLAMVTGFFTDEQGNQCVDIQLDSGPEISIEPRTWTLYRSTYNKKEKQLDQEKLGSFTQIPLRLAWAVTIHKSQGKSFDRVTLDLGNGAFAAGQTYVALSRCRTLEGLTLVKPLTTSQIRLDYAVMRFLTKLQYALSGREMSTDEKVALLKNAAFERRTLEMTYLSVNDERTTRRIKPRSVSEDEFEGHHFLALRAYCFLRKGERRFNVDRILELKEVESEEIAT